MSDQLRKTTEKAAWMTKKDVLDRCFSNLEHCIVAAEFMLRQGVLHMVVI